MVPTMRGIIVAMIASAAMLSGCAHSANGKVLQASLAGGAGVSAIGWGVSSFVAQPSPFVDNDTNTTRMDRARSVATIFEVTTVLCLATAIVVGIADQNHGSD